MLETSSRGGTSSPPMSWSERVPFGMTPFNEQFTGYGYEDIEWGLRLANRWKVQHIENTASHLGLVTKSAALEKMRRPFQTIYCSANAIRRIYHGNRRQNCQHFHDSVEKIAGPSRSVFRQNFSPQRQHPDLSPLSSFNWTIPCSWPKSSRKEDSEMKIVFLAPFGIRPKGTLIARMLPLGGTTPEMGPRYRHCRPSLYESRGFRKGRDI